MEQLSRSNLNSLIQSSQATSTESGNPFVSLYIPKETLLDHCANSQQRLQDMIKKVELLMKKHYPGQAAKLNNIYASLKRTMNNSKSVTGYAYFQSQYLSGFFPVSGKVRELAVVGKSFHVKPLLNEIQNQNRYYVLTLEENLVYLWEGDGHSIEKKAIYLSPEDRRTPHSSIKTQSLKIDATPQKSNFQRHEVRVILKFYKDVNNRIKKHVMNQYDPVYVVAQPQLRALFMGINRKKYLMQHPTLDTDPRHLTAEELHQATWEVASKELYRRMKRIVKDYRIYQFSGRTLESLVDIARAAAAGRIESLLIQKDLYIWGEYQKSSGKIKYADSSIGQPIDDIFDDIAEDVIRRGGQVYLLDAQDMPGSLSAWAVVKKYGKSFS